MRGFYSVAAGIFTQQENINTISNNIANASTTGFKAQENISSSFSEHVVNRMSELNEFKYKEPIGGGAFITVNIDDKTDFTQGRITNTDRALDVAINGDGFFAVENKRGEIVLSRNGQFELDAEGNLILKGVGYVLNEGLDHITLQGSNFKIAGNGEIFEEGESVDQFAIVYPNEGVELTKIDEETFTTGENQEDFEQMEEGTFQIVQGALENSNVDMTEQLTKLIKSNRNFGSCAEMLKIYDSINEISANQIGKL